MDDRALPQRQVKVPGFLVFLLGFLLALEGLPWARGAEVRSPDENTPPPLWLQEYAQSLELRSIPLFVGSTLETLELKSLYLPIPKFPPGNLLKTQTLASCPAVLLYPSLSQAPDLLTCGGHSYVLLQRASLVFPQVFPGVSKADFSLPDGVPWSVDMDLLLGKGGEAGIHTLRFDAEELFALWENRAKEILQARIEEEQRRVRAAQEQAEQEAKAKAEKERAAQAQRLAQMKDQRNLGGKASCAVAWEKEGTRFRKIMDEYLTAIEEIKDTYRLLLPPLIPDMEKVGKRAFQTYQSSMGHCYPPVSEILSLAQDALPRHIWSFYSGDNQGAVRFLEVSSLVERVIPYIEGEYRAKNAQTVTLGGRTLNLTFLQGFDAAGIRSYAPKGKRIVVVRIRISYEGENLARGLPWKPTFDGGALSLSDRGREEVAWLMGVNKEAVNSLPQQLEPKKPVEVIVAWETASSPTNKTLFLAPKVGFWLFRP